MKETPFRNIFSVMQEAWHINKLKVTRKIKCAKLKAP
jgi:hypothetical protein